MWQEIKLTPDEFQSLYGFIDADDEMRRVFDRASAHGPGERRGTTAYWIDIPRYGLKRLLDLAKVYAPTAESAIGTAMEASGRKLQAQAHAAIGTRGRN
jgi:hypothetical protein